MHDLEKIITGLEFTKAMITFNPSTGEDIEPGNLNEANKTTYDACVGAIALLKEQEAKQIVRCKECVHYRYYGLDSFPVSECKIDHEKTRMKNGSVPMENEKTNLLKERKT